MCIRFVHGQRDNIENLLESNPHRILFVYIAAVLVYALWLCCDGLLCIVCIYHIQKWMMDSKTDHIQEIGCLSGLACCPCAK